MCRGKSLSLFHQQNLPAANKAAEKVSIISTSTGYCPEDKEQIGNCRTQTSQLIDTAMERGQTVTAWYLPESLFKQWRMATNDPVLETLRSPITDYSFKLPPQRNTGQYQYETIVPSGCRLELRHFSTFSKVPTILVPWVWAAEMGLKVWTVGALQLCAREIPRVQNADGITYRLLGIFLPTEILGNRKYRFWLVSPLAEEEVCIHWNWYSGILHKDNIFVLSQHVLCELWQVWFFYSRRPICQDTSTYD